MIYVDTREPAYIKTPCRHELEQAEFMKLESGDFLVGEYLIERKRYDDFVQRLTQNENNIFKQLTDLKAAATAEGMRPVLLLEGDIGEQLQYINIEIDVVIKAIAACMLMDIYVVSTPEATETVSLLEKLESGSTASGPGSLRDAPSVPPELMPRYLTEGFPGVGPKTATAMLQQFGTFKAIVNAKKEELMQVDGIGETTAERIVDAANSKMEL